MVVVPVHSFSACVNSRDHTACPSPFQQAPNSNPLLHSPSYPSPTQSDGEPHRYSTDGLGLYQYSQPFPTSADRAIFSPSPQPAQTWNVTTSMASAPIVNPWTSGAYDHPVFPDPRPNMLWPEYQPSHRSSISSQRQLSVYSADGSEHSFPPIKLEGGSRWGTDGELSPSATVAPDRLTNTVSYDGVYGPPSSPYESDSTSCLSYKNEPVGQLSPPSRRPKSSHSDSKVGLGRHRHRRARVPDDEAKYKCHICGLGFVRQYNKKTHMARHDPNRSKDNVCTHDGCNMKFERRTDLERHIKSVHLHLKTFECEACGKKFARKDTLKRHDSQGGCVKRNEVDVGALLARTRPLQSSPADPQAYYPSPRPETYTGFQAAEGPHGLFGPRVQQRADGGVFDAQFSRFEDGGFADPTHGL